MKGFNKSIVVAAGLAATLSLGMMGCSNNSTASSAAISAEQTSAASTATASDESSSGEEVRADYSSSYYGIAYQTPEGFTQSEKESSTDSTELVYYASDNAGSEVYILGNNGVTSLEGVKDEASWGDYYAAAQTAKMEADGETDIKVETGSATVGEGVALTAVRISSKKDGKPIYRDIFLKLDAEGDGLSILLKTNSEETLKLMEASIGSYI